MNNITFGTDGIRCAVGKDPLNSRSLTQLARAIALWINASESSQKKILICSDTRYSSDWIKITMSSKFLGYGLNILDCGVLPTPAALHLIDILHYEYALVITASHNAHTDNGIKIIKKTSKISSDDQEKILSYLNDELTTPNYSRLGTYTSNVHVQDLYCDTIISKFKKDFLRGIKVVLDCANGASSKVAPEIFSRLGAEVISIFDKPTGYNINLNCGSTHINALQKEVLKYNADIGFAFDGDGDRVIAINKHGEVKDGDDMLAVLSHHPAYATEKTIVGTINSNYAIKEYLAQNGKSFVATSVGDHHILEYLHTHNLLLGGEQSGHMILTDHINCSDGILAALLIMEALISNHNLEFNTFARYPQMHYTVPVKIKKELSDPVFVEIIHAAERQLTNGRLIIRYSGTENILRVMLEDKDEQLIKQLGQHLVGKFTQLLM